MQEKYVRKLRTKKLKCVKKKKKGGTYQKDEVVMRSLMLKTALRNHQIHFTKCHANPIRILGIFINKFGFLFCFVFIHFSLSQRALLPDFSVLLPALRGRSWPWGFTQLAFFHPRLPPSQDAISLLPDFSPSPQHSSSGGEVSWGQALLIVAILQEHHSSSSGAGTTWMDAVRWVP